MATTVNLRREGLAKAGKIGFSWTTLFFGFFVPLIRGDIKWTLIMIICGIVSVGFSNFVFCFIYNKIYTQNLIETGYAPADDYSKELLFRAGILSTAATVEVKLIETDVKANSSFHR